MEILVTGGSGFLGREVIKLLHQDGHIIHNLSRRAARSRSLPNLIPFSGSVLEPDDVKRAIEKCSVVIHAAGRVSRNRRDGPELMSLHVDGTRHVLQAAREAGVVRVVYLSTSGTIAVSEDSKEVKDESAPAPIELIRNIPYYLSKVYAENEALRFVSEYQLPLICLNPSLILGPGDSDGSSTGDVRRFLDGMLPAVPRGGMSFVDVRDVARTIITAISRGRIGERYLLTGCNLTTEEFFRTLARMSGRPAPWVNLPNAITRRASRWLSALEAMSPLSLSVTDIDLEMGRLGWYADSAKAMRELNFIPRDPLETLRDTLHDTQSPEKI